AIQHNIHQRTAAEEKVVIIDQTIPKETQVVGEMDIFSALTLLHEEAIYMHQGTQYQVEKLDWDEKKAYVTEVDVDYFTDANLARSEERRVGKECRSNGVRRQKRT